MRLRPVLGASLALSALAAWPLGCSSAKSNDVAGDDGGGGTGEAGTACTACATTASCPADSVCADLSSGKYCVPSCAGGTCAGGEACTTVTQSGGGTVEACVPSADCAGSVGGSSGGSSGSSGGGSGGGSGGVAWDGGGPVTGSVGNDGGSLSALYFGVVGDTRPPSADDVSAYPTQTIQQIFTALALPQFNPPFVVATGDYQFASSGSSSTASQQLSLYLGARTAAGYQGVQFPAFGNHECTGADVSNCGQGNTNGITANYTAFMKQLLAPIQKTSPYYAIDVNATDGSWTSKFVFTAANAWDAGQSSWLTTTMAQKTTYTFVIRHEPSESSPVPAGVAAIDAIIDASTYTLLIVGHSHTFGHYTTPYPREVTIGNGGAPLGNTSKYFGFGLFKMRSDGAIVGDMINKDSPYAADHNFHFVVKPDGTLTN